MQELFEAAISNVNLLPTGLMVFISIYWLTVIAGVLDTDFLDFDIDIDADVDLDADVDVDTDISGAAASLNNILAFFNLGKIPLMIFLSFLILPIWILSVLVNHYTGNTSLLMSTVFLIPIFLGSLFIAKFCTMPFIKLFSKLDEHIDKNITIVGKVATMLLPATTDKSGQAEIKTDGTTLRLTVKTRNNEVINKGEQALVIDYIQEEKFYLVESFDNI